MRQAPRRKDHHQPQDGGDHGTPKFLHALRRARIGSIRVLQAAAMSSLTGTMASSTTRPGWWQAPCDNKVSVVDRSACGAVRPLMRQ